jgi:hypothetical protein
MSTIQPKIARTDLVATPTGPRPTPKEGSSFKEVLGRSASSLVTGAEAAITKLPGGPVLAAAVRGAGGTGLAAGVQRSGAVVSPQGVAATPVASPVPSVPASALSSGAISPAAISSGAGTASTTAAEGPGGEVAPSLDGAVAGGQDMNLYYLQLQEQMAAENRAYTALSNVMKARHDTVKTAINNLH